MCYTLVVGQFEVSLSLMQTTKAFRYRLYPTLFQEQAFQRLAGCRRFIWNHFLNRMQSHYKETGKSLSVFTMQKELTTLRKAHPFLAEQSTVALRAPIVDLHQAFEKFWRKQSRYPRFKSRKRTIPSFGFYDSVIRLDNGCIVIPKIGRIRARGQICAGKPQSTTIRQEPDGTWVCSVVMRVEIEPLPTTRESVGIDVGLTSLYATSDGDSVPAPKFLRKASRKLKKAQQVFCRRQKESNRREEARIRVAKIHRDVKRKREGFLHKHTTAIIRKYDFIAIENLNIAGLAKTKLSRSLLDASLSEFLRQLEYKSNWYGRRFVRVGRFYPSSKTCSICGIQRDLTLSDRIWECEGCGTVHDRDFNAAVNILVEGQRIAVDGVSKALNARGETVRPLKLKAGLGETRRSI